MDSFEQDREQLEQDCERIAVRDPNERASLQADMDRLATFLSTRAPASTETPVVTTAAPRPTTTIRQTPPHVAVECGSAGTGAYDWYRVDFGYSFTSTAPIVEWGMDYGDGKSYSANEETAARNDVYWHKYYSPGTYRATAWVVDSNGLRDEASCTWNWTAPPPPPSPVPAQPASSSSGCDPNYTGCLPIASDVVGRGPETGDDARLTSASHRC